MDCKKIAREMFTEGLRARDCATWDRLKKYDDQLAGEIVEYLAKIEIQHLKNIRVAR